MKQIVKAWARTRSPVTWHLMYLFPLAGMEQEARLRPSDDGRPAQTMSVRLQSCAPQFFNPALGPRGVY